MGASCSKDDGMAVDGSTTAAGAAAAAISGGGSLQNDDPYQQQLQQQQQSSGFFGGCMGSCSGMDPAVDPRRGMDSCRSDAIDPVMYDLCKKSLKMSLQGELTEIIRKKKEESAPLPLSAASTNSRSSSSKQSSSSSSPHGGGHNNNSSQNSSNRHTQKHIGQYHLLYKHQPRSPSFSSSPPTTAIAAATAPDITSARATNSSNGGGDHSSNNNNNNNNGADEISTVPSTSPYSTRLIVRRRPIAAAEEGTHGTHLYAIRYPPDDVVESKKVMAGSTRESSRLQEQCPTPVSSGSATAAAAAARSAQRKKEKRSAAHASSASNNNSNSFLDPSAEPIPEPRKPSPATQLPTEALTDFFQPAKMKQPKASKQTIQEWVTVSEEHCIYVVDVGLTPLQCDKIVQVTEQVCRGQYAAYTYAKQTLGCREFPILAQACAPPVQAVVQAILGLPSSNNNNKSRSSVGKDGTPTQQHLQLDDREPHLVKYDVTKRERQKLDMHTDKSEWTFLIACSNGSGLDYDGGGTYFECLNATIHVQRGHALIFPGKLRHCGQRITRGLRYLLVGFLVDKAHLVATTTTATAAANSNTAITIGTTAKDKDNDAVSSSATAGTNPVSAKTLTTGLPTIIGDTIST